VARWHWLVRRISRHPYIVEQHGAPVPRSTTGSYVSGSGQLFDCKHVAYHNLNQQVLPNSSVPFQHLPAKRTWPEAQPSQRAWSTLSYNYNTTPNEHNQSERTARSTTGSESCGAHFLVTPPQRGRSTIVQKHTSRSTTGLRELPDTYAPRVAWKKKHAQFSRSMAGTYATSPFTPPYASLTSIHTYHWKAVKCILDSTNTEGWLVQKSPHI
jgi:hypothetical protein